MATVDYPLVIAFTGDIGCGKSTAASLLKEYGFEESLFAGPLKKFSRNIGFEEHDVYGTQDEKLGINKQLGISGREFMQKFGTEVCRDALPKIIPNMKLGDNTLWVKVMDNYIKKQPSTAKIAISDARFKDEFDLVKQRHGGIVIRIIRQIQSDSQTNDDTNDDTNKHQSELLMKSLEVDYTIINNGTMDELKNKIIEIVNKKYSIQLTRNVTFANPISTFINPNSSSPVVALGPVMTMSNLSLQCRMINRIFPSIFKPIQLYDGSCKRCYMNSICKDCCPHNKSYATNIFRIINRNIFGNVNSDYCNNIYHTNCYKICYSLPYRIYKSLSSNLTIVMMGMGLIAYGLYIRNKQSNKIINDNFRNIFHEFAKMNIIYSPSTSSTY